jgi:hypothetical protein
MKRDTSRKAPHDERLAKEDSTCLDQPSKVPDDERLAKEGFTL